jgi:hypothetical protein
VKEEIETIMMTMTMMMMILLMALLLAYNTSSVLSFSIPPATTTITTTSTPPPILTPLQQWKSNSNSFSSSSSSTSSATSSIKHPSSSSALLLLADGVTSTSSSAVGSVSKNSSSSNSNNNSNNSNNNNNLGTNKLNFFNSLDTIDTLNDATKERTTLLNKMINEKLIVNANEISSNSINEEENNNKKEMITIIPTISYSNPGSSETFLKSSSSSSSSNTETPKTKSEQPVAPIAIAVGKWKVIYAPHISTAANILNGKFDVQYDLFNDDKDGSTIVSHAYYDFPIIGKGYLSVSGTYGSVLTDEMKGDNNEAATAREYYSKVDFNKAWIKPISQSQSQEEPYESLNDVPDSIIKTIINEIGKRAFVESVAIFPVSFLDSNMIVFEFQLFGTKICAYKQ